MRKVAIIIPIYNGLESLKETINSILFTTKYLNYRIIIVDGGSTDGSREYIKRLYEESKGKGYPFITYIFEEKKEGITKAILKGISNTADDEDIFLTQNDVRFPELEPCWLNRMVNKAYSKEDIGIVTTKNSTNFSGPDYLDKVIYVGTWCMYIPRKTINKVGLLDVNFSPGPGDDVDFTYRVMKIGLFLGIVDFNIIHARDDVEHYNDVIEGIKQKNARYFRRKWNIPTVGVLGLGKLGLPLCAIISQYFTTYGYDINPEIFEKLKKGINPYPHEKNLDDLLKRIVLWEGKSIEEITRKCNFIYIVTATPSKEDGRYDTKYIENALQTIGEVLKDENDYKVIVIVSTVLPGDCRRFIKLIKETSEKEVNKDFGLCYVPEFIAIGNIIYGMTNPDFVIIGESDERAGSEIEGIYNLIANKPFIKRMSLENAELTKIALNSYITMKMNFANTLAEICENMSNGDVDKVTETLGCDKRINPYYLKGGTAYGGPCFPRDNRAFYQSAFDYQVDAKYAKVVDDMNFHQNERILNKIVNILSQNDILISKPEKILSILGMTYKIDVNISEESLGEYLYKSLSSIYNVRTYDPSGIGNCKTLEECLKDSDLAIITVPWNEFKTLDIENFSDMRNKEIIDCWRMLRDKKLEGVKYHGIGIYEN